MKKSLFCDKSDKLNKKTFRKKSINEILNKKGKIKLTELIPNIDNYEYYKKDELFNNELREKKKNSTDISFFKYYCKSKEKKVNNTLSGKEKKINIDNKRNFSHNQIKRISIKNHFNLYSDYIGINNISWKNNKGK